MNLMESASFCSIIYPLRILSFFFSLAIFPSKYLGFNLKLALAVAGTFFFSVLFSQSSEKDFIQLLSNNHPFSLSEISDLNLIPLAIEVFVGFIIALFVGVIGYAVQLWAKLMVKVTESENIEMIPMLFPTLLIAFWYLLFSVVDFTPIFLTLAHSFDIIPCGSEGNIDLKIESVYEFFTKIFLPGLKPIFAIGLILALPFFVVTLVIDLFYLVFNRYLRGVVTNDILLTSKLPVIMLIISFSLYLSMGQIFHFVNENWEPGRFQAILGSLRGFFLGGA